MVNLADVITTTSHLIITLVTKEDLIIKVDSLNQGWEVIIET